MKTARAEVQAGLAFTVSKKLNLFAYFPLCPNLWAHCGLSVAVLLRRDDCLPDLDPEY